MSAPRPPAPARRRRRKPTPPPEELDRRRRQADGYRAARLQNAAEVAEDYVELIQALIRDHGEARLVDMAARLGVSHVTVTKTLRRLQRDGLVRTEPYRSIFLTPAGRQLAGSCARRHKLVVAFLKKIGVRHDVAEQDAEGIEHHVSEHTLSAMRAFVARR